MMLLGIELTLNPLCIKKISKSQKPETPSSPGKGLKPVRVDNWFDTLFLMVNCRKYPLITINRDVVHDRLIVRNGGRPEETGGDGVRAVPMFQLKVLQHYLQKQLDRDRLTVKELGYKAGECFLIEPVDKPIVVHVIFARDVATDAEEADPDKTESASEPTLPVDDTEWVRLRFHYTLKRPAL